MRLSAGMRLGYYEVLDRLGAGGMGEVFRALDTRLGREVALKLLPEGLGADPEGLARFEREARILASLQHPHVATLFAFEEEDGRHFLAMELVQGETLAERIARGPLLVREALGLFRQIAEGLEAAHDRGIVHRDLKPANVRITPDGSAKVLDFGLAKLVDPASPLSSASPTRTAPGAISGTAAYMSPEQARGQPVDRRTDVWAFGASLFEALTGRRAFAGATASDVLVQVLEHDPDWSALPETTPAMVRQLLRRCLRKDASERLRDIADARIQLEDALESSAHGAGAFADDSSDKAASERRTDRGRRRARRVWLAGILGTLTLVAAGYLGHAIGSREGGRAPETARRFRLDIRAEGRPSISPDGRHIAYVEKGRMWIRDLDRLDPREVPESEQAAAPFWSPDGRQVAFAAGAVLKRAPAEGGPAKIVCELGAAGHFFGGTWSHTGLIVVALAPGRGLFSVPAEGGTLRPLLEADPAKGIFDFHWPSFLADGRTLLVVAHPQTGLRLYLAVFDGRELRRILGEPAGTIASAVYAEEGFLVFDRLEGGQSLYAVPARLPGPSVTAEPTPIGENASFPSVSSNGMLLYVTGRSPGLDLVVVDRAGRVERTISTGHTVVRFPRVSPDGKRIMLSDVKEDNDVWVLDLERGTRARLTTGHDVSVAGAWSSSGERIAIMSGLLSDSAVVILRADGSGQPERLPLRSSSLPEGADVSPDWSPDGRHVIFRSAGDLFYGDVSGGGQVAFTRSAFTEAEARFSPDGRYVAYMSNETGRFEVYVRPFPEGDGKWTVSTNGGALPRWSRRGDELFYVEGNALMAVPVSTRSGFKASPPHRLFDATAIGARLWNFSPLFAAYDPMPDGRAFVVSRLGLGSPQSLVLVENWTTELGRRR